MKGERRDMTRMLVEQLFDVGSSFSRFFDREKVKIM